ncbi:organic cation carnitine transporter 7-like [Micractinium conductrix]|uniref:Organic cation carnitine transporter 7-like n=1 Tax=Micractinium conductrix TaxID=554055 RepID=A0A2P6VHX7_9CHLO|nr:organic cation carnitine transporter 7-like [Micractinium conductrix]|eukprot:PSC73678.1 organic cation carnitine transporter 7-like [Micractinium conductrix]
MQWLLLCYCGLGWLADACEVMLLSFLGPAVRCAWNVPPAAESVLSSVVFVGMLLGVTSLGAAADHLGRRRGFFLSAAVLGAAGLASAAAPSFGWLLVLRCIVGFALGGTPIAVTLLAEFCTSKGRGRWLLLMQSFWTLGTLLEAALAWAVLPTLGWRWLLALSAAPLLILLALYPLLPESPLWLASRGRYAEAEAVLQRVAAVNGLKPLRLRLAPRGHGGTSPVAATAAGPATERLLPSHSPGVAHGSGGSLNQRSRSPLLGRGAPRSLQVPLLLSEPSSPGGGGAAGERHDAPGAQQAAPQGAVPAHRGLLQADGSAEKQATAAGLRLRLRPVLHAVATASATIFGPQLRRTTLMLYCVWLVNALVYYGLVLLTTALQTAAKKEPCTPGGAPNLDNRDYGAILITTLAECPGLLAAALLVDSWGRKAPLAAALAACAVALVSLTADPPRAAQLALLFAARGCIEGAFSILYVLTPELYPTSVRSFGLALCNGFSRAGGFLAPFATVFLVEGGRSSAAELLLGGLCAAAALCAALLLHDTRDQDLAADLQPERCSDGGGGGSGGSGGSLRSVQGACQQVHGCAPAVPPKPAILVSGRFPKPVRSWPVVEACSAPTMLSENEEPLAVLGGDTKLPAATRKKVKLGLAADDEEDDDMFADMVVDDLDDLEEPAVAPTPAPAASPSQSLADGDVDLAQAEAEAPARAAAPSAVAGRPPRPPRHPGKPSAAAEQAPAPAPAHSEGGQDSCSADSQLSGQEQEQVAPTAEQPAPPSLEGADPSVELAVAPTLDPPVTAAADGSLCAGDEAAAAAAVVAAATEAAGKEEVVAAGKEEVALQKQQPGAVVEAPAAEVQRRVGALDVVQDASEPEVVEAEAELPAPAAAPMPLVEEVLVPQHAVLPAAVQPAAAPLIAVRPAVRPAVVPQQAALLPAVHQPPPAFKALRTVQFSLPEGSSGAGACAGRSAPAAPAAKAASRLGGLPAAAGPAAKPAATSSGLLSAAALLGKAAAPPPTHQLAAAAWQPLAPAKQPLRAPALAALQRQAPAPVAAGTPASSLPKRIQMAPSAVKVVTPAPFTPGADAPPAPASAPTAPPHLQQPAPEPAAAPSAPAQLADDILAFDFSAPAALAGHTACMEASEALCRPIGEEVQAQVLALDQLGLEIEAQRRQAASMHVCLAIYRSSLAFTDTPAQALGFGAAKRKAAAKWEDLEERMAAHAEQEARYAAQRAAAQAEQEARAAARAEEEAHAAAQAEQATLEAAQQAAAEAEQEVREAAQAAAADGSAAQGPTPAQAEEGGAMALEPAAPPATLQPRALEAAFNAQPLEGGSSRPLAPAAEAARQECAAGGGREVSVVLSAAEDGVVLSLAAYLGA